MSLFARLFLLMLTAFSLSQCRRSTPPPASTPTTDLTALLNAVDDALPELAGRRFYEVLLAKSENELFADLDTLLMPSAETRSRLAAGHVLRHLAARSTERTGAWVAANGERCKPLWSSLDMVLPVLALKAPSKLPGIAAMLPEPWMRQAVWRVFAKAQPALALNAWMDQTQQQIIWPDAEDAMRELLNAASQTDPEAVAQWLAAQPDGGALLEKWQVHFLSTWCLRDAPCALAWCLQSAAKAGLNVSSWAAKCAEHVPTARTDWMRQMAVMLPMGITRALLLERAALFDGKRDLSAAQAWVAGLTDAADREAAQQGLQKATVVELPSGFVVPSDGDEWVRYVEERAVLGLPGTFAWAKAIENAPGLREKALFAAARLWARKDDAAAAAAVNVLERESDRTAAMAGFERAKINSSGK